ncbi:MAG TPA: hypothetical protein PKL31_07650 [Fulvivirga sp.]|nr:hypothetical protein [Fulvivirga sp.]
MQSKYFWNQWPKAYKYSYLLFLTLFVMAMLWMAVSYVIGVGNVLDWNILAQVDKAEIIVKTFKVGPFNLSQSVDSTIFTQEYAGTAPAINVFSYYLFLLAITLVATLLVTVISNLTRFWYYVGIAIFAFFLVSLKLELLLFFGSGQKIGLVIALILYLPLSFYFQSIKTETPLIKRFLAFFGVAIILAILIGFGTDVPHPFFYLSTSMIGSAFLISLLFIFGIAHEIIASFVYLLYGRVSSQGTKNGFIHFIVITLFYLVNLTLAFLHETNIIDWDFLYVNVFILLIISALLGIWGFRHRENQYDYIFKFYPTGALTFLGLGIVCFITIAHLQTTGNDAGLEIFRDFILYSHLGFGIIFLLYIISNFVSLLKKNLPLYQVLYRPNGMPYFTFRFAGIILVVAFVLKSNWQVPVFQGKAAYYNSVADLHQYNGEKQLAERYYKEAANYALYNHKSNYSLAVLSERSGNDEQALYRYKEATKKWPSPQAYVNLSNLHLKNQQFFDALFTAKEAVKKYPESPEVLNTLGLIYGKTSIIDSAIYYLDKASKIEPDKGGAISNIMALLAKNTFEIPVDTVLKEYQVGDDPISINNKLVLGNKTQQFLNIPFSKSDSALTLVDASILENMAINSLYDKDTASTEPITAYSRYPSNVAFKESLEYAACLQLYNNGDINNAFRRLNWLANTSEQMAAKYFDDIGLWALEQGAADVAIEYFQWAKDKGYDDAALHLAIALAENQNIPQAIHNWNELVQADDPSLKQIAQSMSSVLSLTPSEAMRREDSQLYLFERFMLSATDTLLFNSLVNHFEDPNYKAQAILDMARKLWKRDLSNSAIEIYSMAKGLNITDEELYNNLQFFELRMLAADGNIRGLAQKINQDIEFDTSHNLEKAYFTGLINEANGDSIAALINYKFISDRNPFYEESVIAAARYFGKSDAFKSYNVLLSALEINPRSIKLLKAYIYQCALVQQNTSANIALATLKPLVSYSEYNMIEANYKELVNKMNEEWP